MDAIRSERKLRHMNHLLSLPTTYSHNSLEQQIGSAAKGEEEVPKVEKHLVSLKQQ